MKTRTLGKTGLVVSEIGVGCWQLGGNMWGPTDEGEALKALHHAIDLGVTFLDTALVYGTGRSEKILARLLKELGPARAQKIILSSKIPPKNMEWPASAGTPVAAAFPTDHIRASVEKSLSNLGVDRIDVMHLHVWADAWTNDDGWYGAMQALKKEGTIGHVALSLNSRQPDTGVAVVEAGRVEVIQVVYNIFESIAQDKLLPACEKAGVGVIARVPFDEGSLTGTLRADTKFPADDFRARYFAGHRLGEAVERAERVRALIADATGDAAGSLPEAALRFCLSHPAISTVIPGMRRVTHVEQNCRASDRGPLPKALLDRLRPHRWVPGPAVP